MAKVTQVIMQACHDPESDVRDSYIIQGVDDDGNSMVIQKPADSKIVQKAVERFNAAAHAYLASARTDEDNEELQLETDVFLATLGGVDDNGLIAQAREIVTHRIEHLTDRITCDGFHVYYDNGDFGKLGIDPVLEDHLIRIIADSGSDASGDRDVLAWCRFTEKLYSNPNSDIVGRFVEWLKVQNWLTLTDNGNIIGYRGCTSDSEGEPVSIHCGPAIVNGTYVNGHVPNRVGDVVEFDRTKVTVDYANGCASGLHVGTYDYAVGWGNTWLLRVELDPRDVVSVPFDCSSQKVRCCRFKVLDKTPISDLAPTHSWHDDLTYGDGGCGCGSCNRSGDEDEHDRGYDDGYDACLEAIENGDVDPDFPSDPDCSDVEHYHGNDDYTEEYEDGFFDGWRDALDGYEPEDSGDGDDDDADAEADGTCNGGISAPDDAKLQDAFDEASSAAVAAFNEAMSKLRGGNA